MGNVMPFCEPALPTPSCVSSEWYRDQLPSWHLAQENVELLRQNAELMAQMALIHENAALAQANARLVEQLRRLNRKGRKADRYPEQMKANAHTDVPSDTTSTCAASTCGYTSEADESAADGNIGDERR